MPKLRIFVLMVASVVLSSVAIADGYEYEPSGKGFAPPKAYSWTGFYVGGHIGYSWADVDYSQQFPTLVQGVNCAPQPQAGCSTAVSHSAEGRIAGGYVGANYQSGSFVFGAEVSYSDLDADDTTSQRFIANIIRDYTVEVDRLFTAVGRLGYTSGRYLVYAKGGYASAEVDLTMNRPAQSIFPFSPQLRSSNREDGYVIGAGVEFAATNHFIIGLDYSYIDIDGGNRLGVNLPTIIQANYRNIDIEIQSVAARASVKF